MASGTRLIGAEVVIPDSSLKPVCFSGASGDELPIAKQQHAIDILFNFYLNDTTVPPATGIWTVFSPRAAGVIDEVAVYVNTNGTESNNSDVLNIQLNGSDKCTDFVVRGDGSGMAEDTWVAATITGDSFAFVADDNISVDWTNVNTSDATGLKVRIRGYYVGV